MIRRTIYKKPKIYKYFLFYLNKNLPTSQIIKLKRNLTVLISDLQSGIKCGIQDNIPRDRCLGPSTTFQVLTLYYHNAGNIRIIKLIICL